MPKQPDDQAFVPDDEQVIRDELSDPVEEVADAGDEIDLESPPNASFDGEDEDVESLRMELEETRQRVLRLQAELENYRKRAQRTLEEERRFAGLPLMRDLLAVVDNLKRAIEAAEQNENATGLLEGVKMVAEQLASILKRHHCEEIPAEGAPFDPHLHEAIAQFPSDEHEAGHVAQVTQTGYQLHGRVIRPSQVIVAAARPKAE